MPQPTGWLHPCGGTPASNPLACFVGVGEGLPIKAIARVLGVSKNTVKSALAAPGPPKYERAASLAARAWDYVVGPGG